MILKNALHFSLEIWGYIFCIISAICIHISRNINIKVNRTLFFLLTTDGLLLFFDSLAWFFRGNLGKTQYYILVVSNFMVFLLGYVLLFVFTKHLKNYIEQTQFIVITHRRGTMEAANILYGVTMQEKGVSKLLSLHIDDVADDMVS